MPARRPRRESAPADSPEHRVPVADVDVPQNGGAPAQAQAAAPASPPGLAVGADADAGAGRVAAPVAAAVASEPLDAILRQLTAMHSEVARSLSQVNERMDILEGQVQQRPADPAGSGPEGEPLVPVARDNPFPRPARLTDAQLAVPAAHRVYGDQVCDNLYDHSKAPHQQSMAYIMYALTNGALFALFNVHRTLDDLLAAIRDDAPVDPVDVERVRNTVHLTFRMLHRRWTLISFRAEFPKDLNTEQRAELEYVSRHMEQELDRPDAAFYDQDLLALRRAHIDAARTAHLKALASVAARANAGGLGGQPGAASSGPTASAPRDRSAAASGGGGKGSVRFGGRGAADGGRGGRGGGGRPRQQ